MNALDGLGLGILAVLAVLTFPSLIVMRLTGQVRSHRSWYATHVLLDLTFLAGLMAFSALRVAVIAMIAVTVLNGAIWVRSTRRARP